MLMFSDFDSSLSHRNCMMKQVAFLKYISSTNSMPVYSNFVFEENLVSEIGRA